MIKIKSQIRVVCLATSKGRMTHMVDVPKRFGKGKRRRMYFASEVDANRYAADLQDDIEKVGSSIAAQSNALRQDAEDASALLAPYKVSLKYVAELWIELEGRRRKGISLGALRAEVFTKKRAEALTPKYLRRYERFVDDHLIPWIGAETNIVDITADRLYEKLASRHGLAPRSFNDEINIISNFFSYAMQVPTLYLTANPASGIPRKTVERKVVKALEPTNVARFMEATWDLYPELVPYFAVCFWGGVRCDGEAQRTTWEDIFVETREIKIYRGKNRQGRLVDLPENAAAWLKPFESKDGPLLPYSYSTMRERRRLIAFHAGFKWPRNGPRKSCASYTCRLNKSEERTAEKLGHSPEILNSNYNGPVRRSEAVAFFNIYPPSRLPGQGIVPPEATC